MNKPGQHNEPDSLEVFFSKNLGEASMEPSADSWERIEQTLEQDRKVKRKKRFLWFFFTGIVLLTGLSVTGLLFFKDTWSGNTRSYTGKTIASTENTNTTGKQIPAIDTNTLQKQTTETTDYVNPTSVTANRAGGKIQLGAFRRKLKPGYFDKLSAQVQQETGSDGVTRYYFLSADTLKDLAMVKEAGFADAFVQKEGIQPVLLASALVSRKAGRGKKNTEITNTIENIEQALALNTTKKSRIPEAPDPPRTNASNPPAVVVNSPMQKNQDPDPVNKQPAAVIPANSKLPASVITTPEENKGPQTIIASNDSSRAGIPPPVVASDTARNPSSKDTMVNQIKTDTIQPIAKKTSKDSSVLPPFNRWAISVIGGPLFLFNQAQEKLPLTYTGDVRAEYFPIRNLSVTAGISYQENKIEQEQTRFKFSKYIHDDYEVQSSFGSMSIPKNLLLQGFFVQAPVDTFAASYKYDAKVQAVGIPVQANWYFLNRRALQLSVSGGLYTSYIHTQKSHLSLIKEHSRDELYYKDVKTNRLNLLMMFSLGCDVRISKRFYFTAAPSYKYGLTNYSNTPGYVFKPSAFSATGGLKIKW